MYSLERGVFVDHSSNNRRAIRFLPLLEIDFCTHKRLVGGSWRMDETYIKSLSKNNMNIYFKKPAYLKRERSKFVQLIPAYYLR